MTRASEERERRMFLAAMDVWRDESAARAWLGHFNAYLGCAPSAAGAESDEGADRVILLLGQLRHGVSP